MRAILITPDRKRDYTTEQTVDGLMRIGCELFATDLGNGVTKTYSEKEILELTDIDVVIAFFGKVRDNRPPKHYLAKVLKEKFPIVYVDGSEWTSTGYPLKDQMSAALHDPRRRRGEPWLNEDMLLLADHYLKRECYQDDLARKIKPFPFCLTERHLIHNNEKDIDVMCVFGQTMTGLRKQVMDACVALKEKTNYNIVVSASLDESQYRNVISRSRIVIDAWGGGDTCDRFYEAVGAGATCLYQKYNIVVEDPFIDYESAVEYWDVASFNDRIFELLASHELSCSIGNRGKEFALQYHTSTHRASKIKKLIGC